MKRDNTTGYTGSLLPRVLQHVRRRKTHHDMLSCTLYTLGQCCDQVSSFMHWRSTGQWGMPMMSMYM